MHNCRAAFARLRYRHEAASDRAPTDSPRLAHWISPLTSERLGRSPEGRPARPPVVKGAPVPSDVQPARIIGRCSLFVESRYGTSRQSLFPSDP
jgi:hypothetical protein